MLNVCLQRLSIIMGIHDLSFLDAQYWYYWCEMSGSDGVWEFLISTLRSLRTLNNDLIIALILGDP